MKGLEAARRLYAEKGADIIHEHFPEYEGRIAVGLAGSGSQCLGFDDEISRDHDFEPGFCLWLTDADDARIGIELSRKMRDLFGSRVSQGFRARHCRRRRYAHKRFLPALYGASRCAGNVAGLAVSALPTRSLRRSAARVFRDDLGECFRAYGRRSPAACPRMFGAKSLPRGLLLWRSRGNIITLAALLAARTAPLCSLSASLSKTPPRPFFC